jgi:hypothetical protein
MGSVYFVYLSPFLCSLVREALVNQRHSLIEQLVAMRPICDFLHPAMNSNQERVMAVELPARTHNEEEAPHLVIVLEGAHVVFSCPYLRLVVRGFADLYSDFSSYPSLRSL